MFWGVWVYVETRSTQGVNGFHGFARQNHIWTHDHPP